MRRSSFIKCALVFFAALLVPLSSVYCEEKPVSPAAAKPLRVLFIGNSLTYMNDLPGVTARLAKSRNFTMEYATYTPNGYSLAKHAASPKAQRKIAEGGWDLVVLQAQSQVPEAPPAAAQFYQDAQKLSQAARKANPGVKVAFYETMARKNGAAQKGRSAPAADSYEGMQKKVNEAYSKMALENQGLLIPVGEVWQKLRAQRPALNLYLDEVHPSLTGTYLAACVFYAVIFEDSPVGLPYPPEIKADIASAIQTLANEARPAGDAAR
ncbi:MAG: SGNH/GDSL hydrolase family protein [Elusimicrobia bacterium]|nr:SGNH/GDSL hydrolase family protein [Elusimicrobiota bacterium]